jgi:hypothetical protein
MSDGDPRGNLFDELWQQYIRASSSSPRGGFLRLGDTALQTRCILSAVACVVLPIVVEIANLRREVAELKGGKVRRADEADPE